MDSRFVVLLVLGALLGVESTSTEPKPCDIKCGCNQHADSCAFNCTSRDYCPVDCTPHRDCSPPFVCNCGCVCDDGYLIDKKGNCILAKNCPPVCCNEDPNAVPGCECGNTCDTYKTNLRQLCRPYCEDGVTCKCKKGYVLNDVTGKCVRPCDCPKKPCHKCPPNEIYSKYYDCPSQECADADKVFHCPLQTKANSIEGCHCLPGYFRNNGTCVKKEDCPPVCCNEDPNAVPGCECGNTCDTYKTNLRQLCLPYCEDGVTCKCKKGYVLNEVTGKCIGPCDCPKCPVGEVYDECGTACPETCANYGQDIPCTLQCVKGCFCPPGKVRDTPKNGKCIDPQDCPHKCCNGDPNAEEGCECGNTCKLYKTNASQLCKPACVPGKSCKCKAGYVLDEETGRCVLPCDCPCYDDDVITT